jgi:AmiR/NasT family two-component response regulator
MGHILIKPNAIIIVKAPVVLRVIVLYVLLGKPKPVVMLLEYRAPKHVRGTGPRVVVENGVAARVVTQLQKNMVVIQLMVFVKKMPVVHTQTLDSAVKTVKSVAVRVVLVVPDKHEVAILGWLAKVEPRHV